MKIQHTTWIAALSLGLLLALSGCYPKCDCNDQGCFEGMCECYQGYMGDHCQFLAGEHLAASYSAVAISQNNDTVTFTSSLVANTNDITRLSFTNFHGLSTINGEFGETSISEGLGGNWSIASQPLGGAATIGGYGFHDSNDDHLGLNYTITDSAGLVNWTATLTR
ncbi:MAG: hypothetical protein U0176_10355 [Bacteroidia bacterium]